MKRRVLGKTAPFHALFQKKRGISKRCRFERHHKPSSSPGHAENRGRRSCFPLRFASPSLHPTCPRNAATTHANIGPATTPQWWKKSGKPCPASNSPAHLTLRHDRGKVALSFSAYKYPRKGCWKKRKRPKQKGISRKKKEKEGEPKQGEEEKRRAGTFSFERESEGDRERDRQLLERKRGETEGVKHHGRARDRK